MGREGSTLRVVAWLIWGAWIVGAWRGVECRAQHGVVIDAGSSGSRARLYRWHAPHPTHQATHLRIQQTGSFSQKPGVDDLLGDPEALERHVKALLTGARGLLAPEKYEETPLYFMATGGVRALGEDGLGLMANINSLLADPTVNPFLFHPGHATVLSGNEEAYYAWLAANYLEGVFEGKDGSLSRQVGIVELGGSSVQMSFAPQTPIRANKAVLSVLRNTYQVYANSYQTFGTNAMIQKIRESILEQNRSVTVLQDPCAISGDLTSSFTSGGRTYPVSGTGDVAACLGLLDGLVYRAPDPLCFTKPCGIGGFYQPSVPTNMTFYGLGAMKYPLKAIGALQKDGRFTLRDVLHKSKLFCQKSYAEIQEETGRDDPYISVDCMVSLYLPILLHKAFGFSLDTTNILATSTIGDHNIDWTLGAILYSEARFPRGHKHRESRVDTECRNMAGSLHSSGSGLGVVLALALWCFAYTGWGY